jgi:hypothetical protein
MRKKLPSVSHRAGRIIGSHLSTNLKDRAQINHGAGSCPVMVFDKKYD